MTRNPLPAIFLVFAGLYLLTAGGHFYGQDGVTLYLMGKEILNSGGTHVPQTINSPQGRWAKNGLFYSPFGPGQPVTALPLIYIGNIASHKTNVLFLAPAVVSMFNPLITALCLVIFYCVSARFYGNRRNCFVLCMILGLSTPLWPYSKYFYTEPLITLCVLASFLCLLKFRENGFNGLYSFAAGICLAWGVFSRPATVFLFPGMLMYMYVIQRANDNRVNPGIWKILIHYMGFTVPVLVIFAGFLFTNWSRYGDLFAFGYTVDPATGTPMGFHTPLLHGLYILLLSPGKSVFVFALPCLAGLPGFYYFHKKHPLDTYFIIYMFAITAVMYAKWTQPEGGYSWGPRFLLPCIPFLLLPAGEFIIRYKQSLLTYVLLLCSIAGFIIQAGGVCVNFAAYIHRHHNDYYSARFKGYNPEFSPIAGHLRDTIEYIKIIPETFRDSGSYLAETRNHEIVNWAGRLDFWWLHFFAVGLSPGIICILLALNVIVFAAGIVMAWKASSHENTENRHISQDTL